MTVEELKKYVTSKKRICPMPMPWNKFLDILEIKETMPPHLIPLILVLLLIGFLVVLLGLAVCHRSFIL